MDIKKTLIRMNVDDLVPYERNPRKIPQDAIDDVCESYRQCGVIDPIEVDEDNVILAGHTRRLQADRLSEGRRPDGRSEKKIQNPCQ